MAENHIIKIFRDSSTTAHYFREYGEYISKLLQNLDYQAIEKVMQLLLERCKNGRTIFFIGNGGSAATASHFATDLTECSFSNEGICFRAVSLTSNIPLLTALSNDKGYDEVFANQLRILFRKEDVLVAISASGNSPNVVRAAHLAKELGGITIALVGFDGGELAKICDYVVHVKTYKDEYGPCEDIHLILNHMITSYLRTKFSQSFKPVD